MSSPAFAGWRLAPVVAGLLAAAAQAQTSTLAPVQITGNPLRSETTATPATVLAGDELVLRRGASLGETLAGQPGLASTWFGPNANRPVIRGLDGDRIRILENAGASFDASSLSFDHAVPIDPLVVERVEVLRGPAALLYGGNAVGGVVNTIDNRIPRQPVRSLGGAVEARVGGANAERGGAALVESGNGELAVHVDAFGRETSDLHVPRFTPVDAGVPLDPATRVRNSAARASGGALGVSRTSADGYIGIAGDLLDSRYGVVAEPDVTIRLQRERLALAGERRGLDGPLRSLRAQFSRTVYRHQEIEGGGEVGTTFDHRGSAGRIELEHAPLGAWRGVVGLQGEEAVFSALGEEAFVPGTRTRSLGLFALEETDWTGGRFGAGVRVERVRVASDGDAAGADPRFGAPAERRFTPGSASLSNLWTFRPGWGLATTLSLTQRAPTSFELFANGVHAATGAYERGDASLAAERSRHAELALQWQRGEDRLRAGVYAARFANYIALEATGNTVEDVPEYVFRAVRARFAGLEIEGRHRLLEAPWTLTLEGNASLTRASNADTGAPLPRIAPLRALLALEAAQGPWRLRAEVDHAARQDRFGAGDQPTPGWTLLNLALARRVALAGSEALWFLKLNNAGDRLATSASALQTVRDLAPLPGRALKAGLRVVF
ncbi:MAG: TonB-dependent receptor [Piscinibacter sp.]|uniref:TonB-dependent receptor n=1 Tax=Piscinibacter sp. TaxID=1903157 RepID=UPI00258ABBF2|nr:TonB-dependent receptor [Piscinibacter sp.]MCW5662388.1 TonB-dependent receptor [Piscinibacter sp.]